MSLLRLIAISTIASLAMNIQAQLVIKGLNEPICVKKPHERTMHGDTFVDQYFWYRDKTDKDLLAHLRKENAYADAVMAKTKPLQDLLYKELVGRIKETDLSLPVFDRGYWYYSKTIKGKQYRIVCRRKGTMKAKEQVVLDLNALAKGKPFLGIGGLEVSPNGNFLAYSVDETGHRDYVLRFKNLAKSAMMGENFGVVSGFEWAQDNSTIYYTTENESKRTNKLWRRALGSRSKAEFLYEEADEMYDLGISSSRDHNILFVQSESKDTSEARTVDLRQKGADMSLIAARREGIRYYPDFHLGKLYIRTNEDAREFRVVRTTLGQTDPGKWQPFLPQRSDASIDGIDFFGDQAVISLTKNAGRKLETLDLKTGRARSIEFPEMNYTASLSDNRDSNATKIRVNYTSLVTPSTIFEVDLKTLKRKALKVQDVIGYVASKYKTEQVWATARDGVKVPISLAYRKGTKKSASTPMFIDAYGAYGSSNFPEFASSWVSLMDRGFIVASAHIRGGGDMGEHWYYDGKLANKIHTFHDFIDCADALVKMGYTSHQRIAITGGSAGGLTMGAVLNMRPDICKVALVYVPFVDVINTMSDESIPLTTQEFIEWGNPKIAEQYAWIREYSPYDNISKQNYPAILTRTSLNDSQVPYWEPAKWVSRLRDMRTNKEPLIFKINMNAGHGGSSGRYDALKERAYDYAFMFSVLGIKK